MKLSKLFFSIVVIFLFSLHLSAQIPRLINYQGLLQGSDEQPVAEGDYKVTFSIYDEGNNLLWSEVHPKIFVIGGFFHVLLGAVTPLNLTFDKTYLVGIKVNNDPEMQPRMLLTSSAYSLNSERVGGYEVSPNPEPYKLLPLDSSGKIPSGALPSGSTAGNYLSKNTADSTKGNSATEMLRVENSGTGRGMMVVSSGSHGVYGKSTSSFAAVEGEGGGTGPGIRGSSNSNHGAIGYSIANDKAGVYGNNTDGIGVYGNSQNNHGVYGQSNSGRGVKGVSAAGGVYGESTQGVAVEGRSNANDGVVGWSNNPDKSGVFGNSPFGNGVTGISKKKDGVFGISNSADNSGVYGYSSVGNGATGISAAKDGIYGSTQSNDKSHAGVHAKNEGAGPAVYSEGDIYTTGKAYGNIGPSEGAPFPRPAYNSGWIEVTPPVRFTLGVDQILPTSHYDNNNFFIDMMTKTSHQQAGNLFVGEGDDDADGGFQYWGTSYEIENNNSITVRVREHNDAIIRYIRIRIWYIK